MTVAIPNNDDDDDSLSLSADPITIEYDHMLFPCRCLYLANMDSSVFSLCMVKSYSDFYLKKDQEAGLFDFLQNTINIAYQQARAGKSCGTFFLFSLSLVFVKIDLRKAICLSMCRET